MAKKLILSDILYEILYPLAQADETVQAFQEQKEFTLFAKKDYKFYQPDKSPVYIDMIFDKIEGIPAGKLLSFPFLPIPLLLYNTPEDIMKKIMDVYEENQEIDIFATRNFYQIHKTNKTEKMIIPFF